MAQWRTLAGSGLAAALLFAGTLPAFGRATWHHANSPFRAVFRISTPPNHPRAGLALAVPTCNLGSRDGSDLLACDDRGAQLPLYPLGPGSENRVLALVQARPESERIYVYFGSGARTPVHQRAFLPGLTCEVRTLPEGPGGNWQQVSKLLEASDLLGRCFVDSIELAANPVDSTDACILVFDGYLAIPKAGPYTYMIVTDDAGYLFIDDELLIERNGRRYARDALRGEFRTEVNLSAGPHRIRLVVVDFGGDLMAVVARWLSGREKYALRPEDFLQPGKTELVDVEARYADAPMPAFHYTLRSYMSVEAAQFTEVELATYNGKTATWEFEDGATFTAPTVRRIIPGLTAVGVRVSQQRLRTQGLIRFPEFPPEVRQAANAEHFSHYSELILQQNLARIDPAVLGGYLTLLGYRELNHAMIPVCEAMLANPHIKTPQRSHALLQLARAAARSLPEKADKAYQDLLNMAPGKGKWTAHAREYGDFLLYGSRDFKTAETLIRHMERFAGKDAGCVQVLRLDLALQQGDADSARALLSQRLAERDFGEQQRYAVVQGNALRERFHDLLQAGLLLDAWALMHDWLDVAPSDRANGSLALARARLWQQLGWLDGALGELDGAMLLDPLLPNLPEVEFERGIVLKLAGNSEQANKVFRRVVSDYPNHPVAAQARTEMQ